jgi:hypothetical protein
MKAILAAAALLLAACSDGGGPVGPAGSARVQIDRSVYSLRGGGSEVTVSFTVRNTSAFALALPGCYGRVSASVERREANGWVPRFSTNGCPPVYPGPPPVVLAPGESAADQVILEEGGHYRLRLYIRGAEDPEFAYDAVSAEFEVVSWPGD